MADLRSTILAACRRFMIPIARILLRHGVGFKEFADLSKSAFVEVASNEFGIRGRKTNISRVAIMTGLTRKEVRKVRNQLQFGNALDDITRLAPASVLHYWHHNPNYLDEQGKPLDLPYLGSEVSFSSLVNKYSGDIPPGAMRTELLRGSAIEVLKNGKLRAKKWSYIPIDAEDKLIEEVGFSLSNLASTISYNMNPNRNQNARLERYVANNRLRKENFGKFRRLARRRSLELLETLEEWFEGKEVPPDEWTDENEHWVGVGVYYFEQDKDT